MSYDIRIGMMMIVYFYNEYPLSARDLYIIGFSK